MLWSRLYLCMRSIAWAVFVIVQPWWCVMPAFLYACSKKMFKVLKRAFEVHWMRLDVYAVSAWWDAAMNRLPYGFLWSFRAMYAYANAWNLEEGS